MKRPSLYERAERAAKRFADSWKVLTDVEYANTYMDFTRGYLAGYRAAKRERRK
jgi:hypothetical protein